MTREEELKNIKLKSVETETPKGNSMLEELKKVQLKKVDVTNSTNNTARPGKISKNETNILQQSLMEAIKQRRLELTKNYTEDSEDEHSDWSD